jgi:Txe/YoeB family toxin of Txe-Axe toxin-antitoxin module
MKIKELSEILKEYIKTHQLEKKYEKVKLLFEANINHPSLNVEVLEPKHLKIYSFRIDKKYRAVFIVTNGDAEIITITNHYK